MRILLVDDHPDTVESLALLLRRRGHEVSVAHDGQRGLEAARSLAPEAVLLDLGLPDLDGFEVARELRGAPGGTDLLVVAVTGYIPEHGLDASLFDASLQKPIRVDELSRALESAARRRAGP